MSEEVPAYGLWSLVIFNSAVFILFSLSFFKPRTRRDWRSFGAFSGFLVALFTEMYGFPLTIYFLSGWLQALYPSIDWFSHDAGHLPEMLFGWTANPHLGPFHLLSFVFIGGGFVLISTAWRVLYEAQRAGTLAETGPYARVRHPQYLGFILIMLGFLLQWPTILTLAMFPALVVMYWRLAVHEEREVEAEFGDAFRHYAAQVPPFIPRLNLTKEDKMGKFSSFVFPIALAVSVTAGLASAHSQTAGTSDGTTSMMGQGMMSQGMMGPGLMMPSMDAARGRKLFASKGCVVCHSVNGVGGKDALPLDATTMPSPMNPFDFTAKMWRGAEAMIYVQREELGEQIEFTGDELADIIAFVHNPEEQKKFSETDIPPRIEDLMHHMGDDQGDEHKKEHETDKPKE
jgi:protein-S-isoprenylcysteine O-methyltransferase Ste14